MAVSPEEVSHIASLARLRLDPGEVEALSEQLSDILDHMEALRSVEAGGLPVMDRASGGAPLRADGAEPDALLQPPSAFAPAWSEPFFVVPRLSALDGGNGSAAPTGDEG